jgi:hypothetical protein
MLLVADTEVPEAAEAAEETTWAIELEAEEIIASALELADVTAAEALERMELAEAVAEADVRMTSPDEEGEEGDAPVDEDPTSWPTPQGIASPEPGWVELTGGVVEPSSPAICYHLIQGIATDQYRKRNQARAKNVRWIG